MPNDLAEEFTKKLIENGAHLIGLGARDTLRLEAGLCLYGHELGENITPIEANLTWAISKERMENGGFIGSDKIMNQLNDGTKQIRVGIKPEGRLIAREKTKIYNKDELIIGEITSGTFGPSVSGPVAMGYVEKEFSKKDTKVFLEVRGKKHPANVCVLPFYKKSYVKGATK
jgi:aminomethyltransferase